MNKRSIGLHFARTWARTLKWRYTHPRPGTLPPQRLLSYPRMPAGGWRTPRWARLCSQALCHSHPWPKPRSVACLMSAHQNQELIKAWAHLRDPPSMLLLCNLAHPAISQVLGTLTRRDALPERCLPCAPPVSRGFCWSRRRCPRCWARSHSCCTRPPAPSHSPALASFYSACKVGQRQSVCLQTGRDSWGVSFIDGYNEHTQKKQHDGTDC